MPQVTNEELLTQLDRLKRRPRNYTSPPDYKTHLPGVIPNTPDRVSTEMQEAQLDSIGDRSSGATREALIMQQNKRDYDAMIESQSRLAEMQKRLKTTKRPKLEIPNPQPVYQSQPFPVRTAIPQPAIPDMPKSKGKTKGKGNKAQGSTQPKANKLAGVNTSSGSWSDSTPLSGVGAGANLVTMSVPGGSITVNKSAANNFVNFVKALAATGYKIHDIGGYRAGAVVAGTSTPSLHGYGLAIDINPTQNPVTYNGVPSTNMPPGVARLAHKYGLTWGGTDWNGSKTDAMHFSIRYKGMA